MKIFIYVVACEALVQLWFYALPLQGLRSFFIRKNPWLRVRGEHLFECKYCTSFWVGVLCLVGFLQNNYYLDAFALILGIHRLSNFLHLVFSFILDKQFDVRVARRKDGNI